MLGRATLYSWEVQKGEAGVRRLRRWLWEACVSSRAGSRQILYNRQKPHGGGRRISSLYSKLNQKWVCSYSTPRSILYRAVYPQCQHGHTLKTLWCVPSPTSWKLSSLAYHLTSFYYLSKLISSFSPILWATCSSLNTSVPLASQNSIRRRAKNTWVQNHITWLHVLVRLLLFHMTLGKFLLLFVLQFQCL